jgi:hypothetical protein
LRGKEEKPPNKRIQVIAYAPADVFVGLKPEQESSALVLMHWVSFQKEDTP